jgi:hypothetical protein
MRRWKEESMEGDRWSAMWSRYGGSWIGIDRLEEDGDFFLFYYPDTRALDVVGTVESLELYQTFFRVSDPRWSCSRYSCADLQL